MESLQIVDAQGKVRIRLGCTPAGQPQIALFGNDGSVRLALGLEEDNAAVVTLRDHTGNRVQVAVGDAGRVAGLVFWDSAGKPRLRMSLSNTAQPEVALRRLQ